MGLWQDSTDCSVTYSLTYVKSEGDVTTYSDWASKIELVDGLDGSMKIIRVLTEGFTDNEYAGKWHQFKLKATA